MGWRLLRNPVEELDGSNSLPNTSLQTTSCYWVLYDSSESLKLTSFEFSFNQMVPQENTHNVLSADLLLKSSAYFWMWRASRSLSGQVWRERVGIRTTWKGDNMRVFFFSELNYREMNIKYSTAKPPGKPNYLIRNIKLKKKSITVI